MRQDVVLDCFYCSPSLQSFLTHVPPKKTFFDSTKGNIRAEHRPHIDGHLAGLERLGGSVGLVDVVGEDSNTQAMLMSGQGLSESHLALNIRSHGPWAFA